LKQRYKGRGFVQKKREGAIDVPKIPFRGMTRREGRNAASGDGSFSTESYQNKRIWETGVGGLECGEKKANRIKLITLLGNRSTM